MARAVDDEWPLRRRRLLGQYARRSRGNPGRRVRNFAVAGPVAQCLAAGRRQRALRCRGSAARSADSPVRAKRQGGAFFPGFNRVYPPELGSPPSIYVSAFGPHRLRYRPAWHRLRSCWRARPVTSVGKHRLYFCRGVGGIPVRHLHRRRPLSTVRTALKSAVVAHRFALRRFTGLYARCDGNRACSGFLRPLSRGARRQ